MKISKRTLEILKNYSQINSSIFFDEKGVIKTMSLAGNIIAIADIDEQIPDFGVYNLPELLGMISLFDLDTTEFEFEEKFVTIKYGRRRFRYLYTNSDLLSTFGKLKESEKYKAFDKWNASFELSEDDISSVKKASSIMKLSHIEIEMKDDKGTFVVMEEDGKSNSFKIDIEGQGNCKISFNVANMLLLPGNYTVTVCDKMLIKFMRDCGKIFYLISPKV